MRVNGAEVVSKNPSSVPILAPSAGTRGRSHTTQWGLMPSGAVNGPQWGLPRLVKKDRHLVESSKRHDVLGERLPVGNYRSRPHLLKSCVSAFASLTPDTEAAVAQLEGSAKNVCGDRVQSTLSSGVGVARHFSK